MFAILFPVSIFSLTFPDDTNDFNSLVERIYQAKPLDLNDLESIYYSESNEIKKMKALNSIKIAHLTRAFLILVNHYNRFFPFEISRSNNFLKRFEKTKKLEFGIFHNLENNLNPNIRRRNYKEYKPMRKGLISTLTGMTSQIFLKLNKRAYDSFYIFALTEIKSFIEEIPPLCIENKRPYILLCYKIECSILCARTSYYLSTLQQEDYFYEEFLISKYILYSISIDIGHRLAQKSNEIELSDTFTFKETFKSIKYKIIGKFLSRSRCEHKNMRIYSLFLCDCTILFRELLDFIDFVAQIRRKTEINDIFLLHEYISSNFESFKQNNSMA